MSGLRSLPYIRPMSFAALLCVSALSAYSAPSGSQAYKDFLIAGTKGVDVQPIVREDRKIIAMTLLEKVKDFNAQIPELRPDTIQWLEQEIRKCKGARCQSLFSSREFVHSGLKNNANSLEDILEQLIESFSEEPAMEIYVWSYALTYFRDRHVFEDYEWMVEYSFLEFEHELGSITAKLIGSAINSAIIRPFIGCGITGNLSNLWTEQDITGRCGG